MWLQCRNISVISVYCPSGCQLDHKEGAADRGSRHRWRPADLRNHHRAEARLPGEQAQTWQPHHHLHTRYTGSISGGQTLDQTIQTGFSSLTVFFQSTAAGKFFLQFSHGHGHGWIKIMAYWLVCCPRCRPTSAAVFKSALSAGETSGRSSNG